MSLDKFITSKVIHEFTDIKGLQLKYMGRAFAIYKKEGDNQRRCSDGILVNVSEKYIEFRGNGSIMISANSIINGEYVITPLHI